MDVASLPYLCDQHPSVSDLHLVLRSRTRELFLLYWFGVTSFLSLRFNQFLAAILKQGASTLHSWLLVHCGLENRAEAGVPCRLVELRSDSLGTRLVLTALGGITGLEEQLRSRLVWGYFWAQKSCVCVIQAWLLLLFIWFLLFRLAPLLAPFQSWQSSFPSLFAILVGWIRVLGLSGSRVQCYWADLTEDFLPFLLELCLYYFSLP